MKKLLKFLVVFLVLMVNKNFVYADTTPTIDFTITEKINITGEVGYVNVLIDPIVINNNSSSLDISVEDITVETTNEWQLVDYDSDFNSYKANSNLLAISSYLGDDLLDGIQNTMKVNKASSKRIGLNGKISRSGPCEEQVANITVKLAPVIEKSTVLYEDGTFIINELSTEREANIAKHGTVLNTYNPLNENNPYVFSGASFLPWYDETSSIMKIEIGSYIQPTNTAYWFAHCYNLTDFDSTNLDMSKSTSTYMMFFWAGKDTTTSFVLKGLDDWDVSNVTTFAGMFNQAGYSALEWSIGDLSNWNLKSAENLSSMFYKAGTNATNWTIGNLDHWDVSSVTSFVSMFYEAGMTTTDWDIGDLSKWNMSKAQRVNDMFYSAGKNSTSWDIGDLKDWDLSKVTTFENMFRNAGYSASIVDLGDLDWDMSSATSVKNMFYSFGYKANTINLGTLTISGNNDGEGFLRNTYNLNAVIKVKGALTSYKNIMLNCAKKTNGNVQLVPLTDEAATWCNEIVSLYGNGVGNIWI